MRPGGGFFKQCYQILSGRGRDDDWLTLFVYILFREVTAPVTHDRNMVPGAFQALVSSAYFSHFFMNGRALSRGLAAVAACLFLMIAVGGGASAQQKLPGASDLRLQTSSVVPEAMDSAVATTGPTDRWADIAAAESPLPPEPLPDPAPYEPTGIRAGGFILRPAIEIAAGYSTNIDNTAGGEGAYTGLVSPEIRLESDWNRHAFSAAADLVVETESGEEDIVIEASAETALRLDITDDAFAELSASWTRSEESGGSGDIPSDVQEAPELDVLEAGLTLEKTFNRLSVRSSTAIERAAYGRSVLADGSTDTNDDQSTLAISGALRVGYDIHDGLRPFAEVRAETVRYDADLSDTGTRLGYRQATAGLGVAIDNGEKLRGTLLAGLSYTESKDPAVSDTFTPSVTADLTWSPNRLTEISARLSTSYEAAASTASDGTRTHTAELGVTRRVRDYLTWTASAMLSLEKDDGLGLRDIRYGYETRADYSLNRSLSLFLSHGYEALSSSTSADDYSSRTVLLGLRAER